MMKQATKSVHCSMNASHFLRLPPKPDQAELGMKGCGVFNGGNSYLIL